MKISKKTLLIFLSPAVIIFLLVFAYPSIKTIAMSFFYIETVASPASKWEFIGLGNYIRLFETDLFMQSLWNFLRMWIFGGIATLLFAVIYAVILTSGVRGKQFFKAVLYLPNVVSIVAMGNMFVHYTFNLKYGIFTSLFAKLGWDSLASVQWMSPEMIFISMNIANVFINVGYFVLIYVASIERIPGEIYESATIDGAGKVKQFRYITFPLIKDVSKTTFTLWSVRIVGLFSLPKVFSPITSSPQTITPMVFAYEALFGTDYATSIGRIGVGTAACVVMTIMVVVLFMLSNVLFKNEKHEF